MSVDRYVIFVLLVIYEKLECIVVKLVTEILRWTTHLNQKES